jgi:hypothetical protein
MKIVRVFGAGLLLLVPGLPVFAQEAASATNSFFDKSPVKEYQLQDIYVGGEVENPGPVALASLPVRELAVQELAFADGKPQFKGAYFVSGYSLYDILKSRTVKKTGGDFKPEVDLFVEVENAKGEKAVFSWGEIYYARNNFNSLIYRTARSITPGKKTTDWPLPETSRLVCSADLYNTRFIANPVKITVRSAPGTYPGKKHAEAYAPEVRIVAGAKTTVLKDPAKRSAKRQYVLAGYGHGTGFKDVKSVEGFVFKDILAAAGAVPQSSGDTLVVVSAGDSYRAAFSLSELINRGDNADFLLVDRGTEKYGRFSLFSAADFFVDRNVRSVAKVELLRM